MTKLKLLGLRDILFEEAESQERIRLLLNDKIDAVTMRDANRVEQVLTTLNEELKNSRSLEHRRRETVDDLGSDLGIEGTSLSVQDILDHIQEPPADLVESRQKLRSVAQDVQELNRQCLLMVRDSVAFLDEVLDQIHGATRRIPVYGSDGSKEPRRVSNWMNRRG